MRLESEVLRALGRGLTGVVLIAGLFVMSAGAAFGADYGSFSGLSVDYNNVADVSGILGAPTLTNDELGFSVNAFAASSLGGAAGTTSETLTLEIAAKGSAGITDFEISLAGDLNSTEVFVDSPRSLFASANMFIDILEVDGQPINSISVSELMSFSVSGGAPNINLEYYPDPNTFTVFETFTGAMAIDLNQVLAENAVTGIVTRLVVSAGFGVTAFAAGGATSMIEIKEFRPITTIIPEPNSATLLGLGLLGLARRTRTRARAMAL